MKTRYSFLIYIINMTCASTAFTIVTGLIVTSIFGLLTGSGLYPIILGMFFMAFPTFVALISGFISSISLSFIASRFFHPDNINNLNFQIFSYGIVAFITLNTLYFARNIFVEDRTMTLVEIAVASLMATVLIFAQYYSRRFLVSTIEKRKEKAL